ncbi:MAG TPA: tripartite tricarboxylate transporter substrate binding protein [Burkholderiales bacterium]|jgi:tripartite-type tricarboxylate transporter receptor subunit TctC
MATLSSTLILVGLTIAAGTAWAQTYPSQPIRIIVPFGPGSGSDIVGRRLGIYLQERWKQPVIIDNRPGAQGMIGTEALRSAPADGYTLAMSTNSTHAAAPHLIKNLPYDPIADFEHIALIGITGSVVLVRRDSRFKSIPELAAYAMAHPGQVFFGHADTISQIPGELLRAAAKLPVEGVAYKTSANVIVDLIGGQIQFAFFNYMTGAAQAASGRLVPIAITESRRNSRWPAVPTLSETYPGLEVTAFVGVSAPHGVPPQIVAKLHRAIREAQEDRGLKEPLESVGLTFVPLPLGGYRSFILKEMERWREHVKTAGLVAR